jgi:class 3 adenylate cyclase
MFCDMVGSTSLSEQFDPEDVRDMIAGFSSLLKNLEIWVSLSRWHD